jgi:hypothetical protein
MVILSREDTEVKQIDNLVFGDKDCEKKTELSLKLRTIFTIHPV